MKNKRCVCINLLPGFDQLELVMLAEDGQEIQLSTSVPFNLYNATTRRFKDNVAIEGVEDIIKQLFVAAKLPLTAHPVVLVLPGYFSQRFELTDKLSPEDIQMVLAGEIENHYLFKNNEFVSDWLSLNSKQLFYTAFVKDDIDLWNSAFEQLRMPITVIDTGFLATLRGLMATGVLENTLKHERSWALCIVTDYSCEAALFQGLQLQQVEAIPLGSVDTTTAVEDIYAEVQHLVADRNIDQLILVNNTLRLTLSSLKDRLDTNLTVVEIIQNRESTRSLGDNIGQYPCTLDALGGVLTHELAHLPQFNFASQQHHRSIVQDTLKGRMFKGLLVANGVALLLCGILWASLQGLIWFKEKDLKTTSNFGAGMSISSPGAGAKGGPTPQMPDMFQPGKTENPMAGNDMAGALPTKGLPEALLAKKLYDRNLWLNNLLVSVGANLPGNAWLNAVNISQISQAKKVQVLFKGKTTEPGELSQLQDALNKIFEAQAPKLLQVEADPEQPNVYQWQLGLNITAANATPEADKNASATMPINAMAGGPPKP